MKINFYQIDDILHKMIAPLLIKILSQKKRALIVCPDKEILDRIDLGLWNFSKTKFLPHMTEDDNINFDEQPIILTINNNNLNKADYLIFFSDIDIEFIKTFEKGFYFFAPNDYDKIKDLNNRLKKDFSLNFYKKEDNVWKNFEL